MRGEKIKKLNQFSEINGLTFIRFFNRIQLSSNDSSMLAFFSMDTQVCLVMYNINCLVGSAILAHGIHLCHGNF